MIKPISWITAEIQEASKGILLFEDETLTFSGVSIDSRKISINDLFVAIKGNVHDGHDFIEDVLGNGIRGLVINKDRANDLLSTKWKQKRPVCIAVDDTTKALGDLASFNRKRSNVSVIAITGSNGKTTTREMTTSIIAGRFNTLSATGSFNNEIGLPLTLLRLGRHHKWAVLELGMNSPGEIGRLADICLPDVGVITNIGPAHLEGLGSIEGIMNAKGELLEKIKPAGTAVLNADDQRVLQLAKKTSKNVLLFGSSKKAVIRASEIREKDFGISFSLNLESESVSIDLDIPGRFMVSNALAAAATGYLLGLSADDIKAGLEGFKPIQGRMNILKTTKGVDIIDDTYNANPDSVEVAIITLRSLRKNKRGFIVLGDMLELGKYAEPMHKKIGLLSAGSDITRLYVTGEFAEKVAEGAKEGNMDYRDIFKGTQKEILTDLTESLGPDDWVLVKGSRAMGMEKIVKGLIDWGNG